MRLRGFLTALSRDSIAFRFFGFADLAWVEQWALDVDYADRFGLVATRGPEQEIVGHGAYLRESEDRAEVAFMVADAWQGHGIATIMLAHLAAAAEQHGISEFTALVLPLNHRMIEVFRQSGFPVRLRSTPDGIEVEFPTSLSAVSLERFEGREQAAAVAALERFLRPRSVAVIGASRDRATVGGAILHHLLADGYTGVVYPVNTRAATVDGRPAHRSVGAVPGPVDLAVVAVPAEHVTRVALECGAAGVRALVVISAGFAEVGAAGRLRQGELLRICRESGMRLVGPNCLGLLNTDPAVQLDATFAARVSLPGRVGFLSQSGGVGIAVIEAAYRLGLGLSSFVSVGNMADVSGNDLLQYWEHDPRTDVVLLYLESFGNPRRFARIARRVSAVKPIVAVKSGRSPAGARATSSHTGALVSASDVTVDALFSQAGVIRADTLHELFDVAALLASQPAPRGGRVAIVTNVGGPGIVCADACQGDDLSVVEPSDATKRRLARFLAPEASLGNPIDMVATASAEDYRRTIEVLVQDRTCDAIIAIFVPALVTRAEDVARELRAAAELADGITMAAVFMNAEPAPSELASGALRVPAFAFPEEAARSLARGVRYSRWRSRPIGAVPKLTGCRLDEAAAIIAVALAAGEGWLGPKAVADLLACYGLPLVATRVASGIDDAVAAAAEFDGPVALKAVAPGLVHKTDAGAVQVGLTGPSAVRAGGREIKAAVTRAGFPLEGFVIQPMAPTGVELLIGVVHDEHFGPVIVCGAGGTSAELLKDVSVRITPLTDVDAAEMLTTLRTYPLLNGYRGAPVCNIEAVKDVLLRLSALVDTHSEVAELDLNPVIVGQRDAVIVDARIRLQASVPQRPLSALRG
ncbi:MAG: GNAT family N-acetyltransferase [Actinomycetota bacterium]|nr:GNAT family N-acetyltransferase [Actinomycetota bacterium]